MSTAYVSRINQVDAGSLDDEIYNVLKAQTKEITNYCPPGSIDKWQPEIDAFLKFLIWNFSLRNGTSTFGQQLLNLRFTNFTRKKAILYLALSILPKYMQEKLASGRNVTIGERAKNLKFIVDWSVDIVKLLEFVNLLSFLHRGTQPRVIERILGISSQSVTTHKPRNIGYSYMTRELLWHGLMELFSMGLPIINFHYLKQTAIRFWYRKKCNQIFRTTPTMNLSTKCPYCRENPVLPFHAGCEHVFCYYCLKANFAVTQIFECQDCGMELHADNAEMYIADVSASQISTDI